MNVYSWPGIVRHLLRASNGEAIWFTRFAKQLSIIRVQYCVQMERQLNLLLDYSNQYIYGHNLQFAGIRMPEVMTKTSRGETIMENRKTR